MDWDVQLGHTPPQLVALLGTVFTKNLAASTEVLEVGRFALVKGISFSKCSGLLQDLALTHHYSNRSAYARSLGGLDPLPIKNMHDTLLLTLAPSMIAMAMLESSPLPNGWYVKPCVNPNTSVFKLIAKTHVN